MTTHYEKLGVSPTATPAEIKRAYRQRAAETHPDKGGNDAEFAEVGKAYETLKDPERRLLYDATGRDSRPPIEIEVQNALLAAFNMALAQDGDIEITAFVREGFEQYLSEYPKQMMKLEKRKDVLIAKRAKITSSGVNLVHQIIDGELRTIDAKIFQMEHQADVSNMCLKTLETYEEEWEAPQPIVIQYGGYTVSDMRSTRW